MRDECDFCGAYCREIDKLEKKLNDSINFHCPHYKTNGGGNVSCHNKLEKRLALAIKALEFYADKRNCDNAESCFVYEIDLGGDEIADEGRIARKALAKIKENLNE